MTTGFDHGGRTVCPLFAGGYGGGTPPNGATRSGRATKMGDTNGQEGPRSGAGSEAPASPREWAMALAVTVLALWGIITPEDIRDLTRSALGLEQRVLHAPG